MFPFHLFLPFCSIVCIKDFQSDTFFVYNDRNILFRKVQDRISDIPMFTMKLLL